MDFGRLAYKNALSLTTYKNDKNRKYIIITKMTKTIMRSMSKAELARAAGVSRKTLMRWLKEPYMQAQLAHFALRPKQHKLPGKLVKIICEHYVIDTH